MKISKPDKLPEAIETAIKCMRINAGLADPE
jgi:hypothetical protein